MLKRILRCFEVMSGLKINFHKSKVCGVGIDDDLVQAYANKLNCLSQKLPLNYLGMPLGANPRSKSMWQPVVDKFRKKLALWKRRCLSFAGRLTLIKSVLSGLPVYFLSLFKMPVAIANKLDSIQSSFLWGGDEVRRKVHLVKWEEVCKRKCQGGLGVRKLSEFNVCLLIKWWWKFGVEDKALWKRVVCSKYGQSGGRWSPVVAELGGVSILWKDILGLADRNPSLKDFFVSNFKIVLGNGSRAKFWVDLWCNNQSLSLAFPRLFSLSVHKDGSVADFAQRSSAGVDWNLLFRRHLFAWEEEDLVGLQGFLMAAPNLRNNVEDKCSWLANPSGAFSVASVWDWMASQKGCNLRFVMTIWNNIAPPRVQFLTWLAWKGRMKSAAFMQRVGALKSDANTLCVFCKTEVETQSHVLLHCSSIWKVWSGILDWWGLCWAIPESVQSLLSWWAGHKVKKKVKMLWRIVPLAVLWSVWVLRNNCLFNNTHPHAVNLEELVKVRVALWAKFRMKDMPYSVHDIISNLWLVIGVSEERNMPAGIMISARQMPTLIGTGGPAFGSSSGLTLGQPNLMDGQLNPLEIAQSTAESDVGRMREDDVDSKSGSDNHEGGSGDDQDPNSRKRKKRYHRHTQHQIQEMEAFFKECPHPDDKQRKELSRELGLEPLQIKFWFQNKRTQMKMQHERHDNTQLRAENEKLRAENMRYREALSNASCPTCGGPTALGEMSFDEHHLRVENSRLREEIDRIAAIAAKYVGKPVVNYPIVSPPITPRSLELGNFGGQPGIGSTELYGAGDLLRSIGGHTDQADKQMIVELAVAAMEELTRMAQIGDPLWMPGIDNTYVLNEEEYFRTFPRGIGPKPMGFRSEASRESAVVIMNHTNLVEILMDVNQWSAVFSGIVSRAMTMEVLSTGVAGNYNGALQVMTAEFQVLSPLVPTRETYFVRYCKHHVDGTWAVVDVSLDSLRPSPLARCRRRPSGCLIQEMPNGYSKVTWIEHVEVDDRGVHNIYKPLVNSGLAFGAKRWVSALDRQCERFASAMATNLPPNDVGNTVITSTEGRRSMLKLAERMVTSFCGGVSASTSHTWTMLSGSGADDVRVMTRKSIDDPGRPPGIVLSAATSFWLPVPPKRVFDFLRDEHSRNEWDILSNGGVLQEMAHIANGRETGNSVSLLRVNTISGSQNNMLILQESCSDPTGSFVIYAPVDVVAMNMVLSGGDPDYVAILPSGFAILPDGPAGLGGRIGEGGSGGSLLTVAFQILVDSTPNAKLSLGSVATVNNLIACTVDRIKASVAGENA